MKSNIKFQKNSIIVKFKSLPYKHIASRLLELGFETKDNKTFVRTQKLAQNEHEYLQGMFGQKGLGMAYIPTAEKGFILDTTVPDSMGHEMHIAIRKVKKSIGMPLFDYVAEKGILFHNAFSASPGCAPSRSSILTGRYPWQNEEAGGHQTLYPSKYKTFPDILEEAGYHIGYTGKGCAPFNWLQGGRNNDPAGPEYNDIRYEGAEEIELPTGIPDPEAFASMIILRFALGSGARPNVLPSALALSSPALTLSCIIERSNSANTPHIWNIALPDGVEVSIAC